MTFKIEKDRFDFSESMTKEWIDSNIHGAYSSSTLINCHSRKYHGLLAVPLRELAKKFVILSKMELTVVQDDQEFDLYTYQYPSSVSPKGFNHLRSFEYNHYPKWTHKIEEINAKIEESYILLYEENTLLIKYKNLRSAKPLEIQLAPLFACRDIHCLAGENHDFNVRVFREKQEKNFQSFKIRPYEALPEIHMGFDKTVEYYASPVWLKNVEYLEEQKRGFDYREDIFRPGIFETTLSEGEEITFVVSLTPQENNLEKLFSKEIERRKLLEKKYTDDEDDFCDLKVRANSFITKNYKGEKSIIAGYHWFVEWGRDAMISLPGLTFYLDDKKTGIEILKNFMSYQKDGIIPNYLPQGKGDQGSYHSADATLWWFWALQQCVRKFSDYSPAKEFLLNMKETISYYIEKKNQKIHITDNGLFWAGNRNDHLTWMDANIDGISVTSRWGYTVELNALWFNALSFYIEVADHFKEEIPKKFMDYHELFKKNFLKEFYDEKRGFLADVINDNGKDFSIRPNQIFAVSMPYCLLNYEQRRNIFRVVREHLLTPLGLRTLSHEDPEYQGTYKGDYRSRDRAYHQGTVWPWLLGAYVEASLKVFQDESEINYLKNILTLLVKENKRDYGLMTIAEIFDGDFPHQPNGCISQAWSVAEIIRGMEIIKDVEKKLQREKQ